MRKAFSLVEMITVMAVFSLFVALISPVFLLFGRDIPRSTELVAEQGMVLDILDQVRQDVDQARALPLSHGQWSSNERTLVIEQTDRTVVYQVADGKVTRALLGPGSGAPEPAQEWYVPNASIRWVLWGQGTDACAVEVHSHLVAKLRARTQERLANTHVFFLLKSPKEVAS